MKKIFVFVSVLFLLTGCSNANFAEIPEGHIDKEEYYQKDGFQAYTDYAKYIYPSKEIIINNNKFKKIKEEDIKIINDYLENFDSWASGREWLSEYNNFDKSIINVGNYVRIKTKEGEKSGNYIYGKYISYSIYLFDVETSTLYYMHNNN